MLTTEQLQRLWFPSARSARKRLQTLYLLRVLDRFRPALRRGEGSAPHHWTLDEAGAYVVAAEQGVERRDVHWRHTHTLTVAASPMLAHRVETNEFFTRLAQDAANAHGALSEWYGERTTHTILDGIAKPDGYGVLTLPGRAPIHILLELDRATETIERLHEKAERYTRAIPRGTLRHANPLVLLAVPSNTRARHAAAALADTKTVTVAVWSAHSAISPLTVTLKAHEQKLEPTM